jgi:putative ABC transport system permease protein
MFWLRLIYTRLYGLLRKDRVEQEMEDEMRFHLLMRTRENIERGMRPDEAEREARRRFGNVGRIKDLARDIKGGGFMETLLQDLRLGARMLLKYPGFTLIAVFTLALGIGANTAIFSVVNTALLRPLPFRDPHRLVVAFKWDRSKGFLENSTSAADFVEWRDQNQVFDKIAAFVSTSNLLAGVDEPEPISSAYVSANLFDLLGVQPMLGRGFLPDEEKRGAPVVVLSYSLWQRRFGSDPGLVGKSLTLNGRSFAVVGVMPAGFDFPRPELGFGVDRREIWQPLHIDAISRSVSGRGNYFYGIARLKPNVTLEQAQAEMTAIAHRIEQQHPDTNTGMDVNLVPMHKRVVGKVRPALLTLLGAVGFVLLIACANVTNLLLVRASSRWREIAIRMALGASRARIIRQLLTESVMLSLAGGAIGLLLAFWGVRFLSSLGLNEVPRLNEARVDLWVMSFTLTLSLITGLLFGLAPAAQVSKATFNESLKEANRGLAGSSGRRYASGLLVISEIALALVLLVGAGLLTKSFLNLLRVNPGFNPENVLTIPVSPPQAKYREGQQQIAFFEQALRRIEALPGVRAAGVSQSIPLGGNTWGSNFSIQEQPTIPLGAHPNATLYAVSPKYFDAMGILLMKGRGFTERDAKGAAGVVIIDESLASRFFPGGDAIGKHLTIDFLPGTGEPTPREIIGIAANVKHFGLERESGPQIYESYLQHSYPGMTLVVRTSSDPSGQAPAIRSELRALDRNLLISKIRTMEEIVAGKTASRRFNTLLMAVFAAVALTLAAVGLYGVLSHSVSQRRQEIGIRMAMGAQVGDVLKLVVGQGMRLSLIGVAVGLAGAFGLTRLMAKLLFGVKPTDPLTFALVTAMLIAVALVACYIPARRATKVDPIVVLRCE